VAAKDNESAATNSEVTELITTQAQLLQHRLIMFYHEEGLSF
jgi:hypothetical protein